MSLNSSGNISVIAEEAARTLARLNAAHSGPGLPSPASVVAVGPPDESAIQNFNDGLQKYSEGMKFRIEAERNRLAQLKAEIEATLAQFVAKDEDISDEAKKVSEALDSLPEPPAAVTSPTSPSTHTGSR